MNQGVEIVVRTWNNTPIGRRPEDGYVNATAMCKANGKDWYGYIRSARTKEYIDALGDALNPETHCGAAVPQNCGTDLVISIQGGEPELQGTWIHPRLAIDLARWISPEFAVWMDGWFLEEVQQGRRPEQPPALPVADPIERAEAVLGLVDTSLNLLDRLGGADERERMVYRDLINNTLVRSTGNILLPAERKTMTLAEAFIECGAPPHKATKFATKVGKAFKELYRREHDGKEPSTHIQLVGGRETPVADYEASWVASMFPQLKRWLEELMA